MRFSNKARLFATSATGACAAALAASPAFAQCATSASTVTCTGATTVSNANAGIAAATPPSVAIAVQTGATITADASNTIQPSGTTFPGAVSLTNAGTLGTTAAPVSFFYQGTPTASANTFALTNSGTITGYVYAVNLGGAATANNTGTIAGGLYLIGSGPITLTSSGPIYTAGGVSNSTTVFLQSYQNTSTTTGTVGVNGSTTSTATGGLVSATITGPVAIPASGTTAAVPDSIYLFGVGGAQLNLNALAGAVTLSTAASNQTSTPGGGNSSTAGGTTTTTYAQSTSNVGAGSSATIGSSAQIANLNMLSGPAAAFASVAGTVGSPATSGSVGVSSTPVDSSLTYTSTSGPTGTSFVSTSRSTPVGGTAQVDLATTGQVYGSVTVNANAANAVSNIAGTVGAGTSTTGAGGGTTVSTPGNVAVVSRGTSSVAQTNNSTTTATGDYSNVSTTTQAATGTTGTATIASGANVFGVVTARGDAGATVDNSGRIRDGSTGTNAVVVESSRTVQTLNDTRSSQTTTTASGTVASANSNTTTNTATGGAASFTNRAGGVIEDAVSVSGLGGATLTNAGAIFGNTNLSSSGTTTTTTTNGTPGAPNVTTTTTPAAGGAGNTVVAVSTYGATQTSTAAGGSVTGNYGGTVGAVSGSALAGVRTVNQNGDAGSTATINGVLYANFLGVAGSSNSTSSSTSTTTTTTQPFTAPATPASTTASTSQTRASTTFNSANSTATVTGALRNNGSGTGVLNVYAANGAASATVTGGTVDGGIIVSAGYGSNTTSGTDTSGSSSIAATTAGPVPTAVQQASSSTSFSTNQGVAGTGSAALTTATVGGGVTVFGHGTGAGVATAASLTMSSDSTVAGSVLVYSAYGADSRSDSSNVSTRTGPTAVADTVTASTTQTTPVNYGNATATLAGKSGAVTVDSSFGGASANLTGQSTGGVSVVTGGTLNNSSSQQTYTGTNAATLLSPTQTGATYTSSSTNAGGVASLAIATSPALQATSTSATAGAITVTGFGGSTLSISAGSRVNAGNSGNITVGQVFGNTSYRETDTFAGGVQTGYTITNTSTAVGGVGTLTNAGTIGAATAFYVSAPIAVTVQGLAGANVTNSGTIYGSLTAASQGSNVTTTSTGTAVNDAVLQRVVTTTTLTPVGGPVTVSNTGVITGTTAIASVNGTLTNSGVLRGGLALGAPVGPSTQTQTSTATSSTVTASVATPRFAQTYTVNQNGLLNGGIFVSGATIPDPSTGAAATATLRTSDIAATINLNAGSITLGNVLAQVAPDNTRLTNTALELNGNGYLGVGTTDLPSALAVGGTFAGTLRYVNTPSYGAFVATDPALGALTGTVFTPAVALGSGTTIRGVNLVEKTGSGVFTILGNPYIAPTAASSTPVYTMDVGTFQVSAGEVQLGVAGADPTTGASIFAIRGNVQNNGTLTLGRRVTDGSTTVLQGVALRVDGNFTQSSTGTLALAAAPALVRTTVPFTSGTVVFPGFASGSLGYGSYGVVLSPFIAYDPTTTTSLRSSPSTVAVNGNLTLAGSLAITTAPGSLYAAGRNQDLFTVSGTYSATGLTVNSGFSSPFLTFALTPRTVGTSTVVSLDVSRASYSTVATTANAISAANALQATIPNVITAITAIRNPNTVTDVQGYGRLQDLATVISGFDTQLSAADAATALTQLGSGSFYGSLQAISTTAPFGEAEDQLPLPAMTKPGVGLWFRPTGQFASIDGNAATGSARLRYDNYGGSGGFSVNSGNGAYFGIGGGYGRISAHPVGYPAKATANTYMLGAFGGYRFGGINIGAQGVFGWSNWDASRGLPILSRTATDTFHSKEFRFTARAGYDFDLGGAIATPFAKIDVRHYRFDPFQEQNAGGIGFAVGSRSETVANPELGVRLAGAFAGIQPFAEASYVFESNNHAYKDVSYLGDPTTTFRLQGVDPKGYVKLGGGIQADVYGATLYLRGNYLTSGRVNTGEAQGGLVVRF